MLYITIYIYILFVCVQHARAIKTVSRWKKTTSMSIKYDSNFTVMYFLGIQWWQGMGTNFSAGILLTCFFVVGQQSLSIVLQKSRLNKAIFSCAFQHKKSMLLLQLWKIAITCPHEVQEERRHLKRRRTSSSLAAKWCKINWKVSKIGFTAVIMCLQVCSDKVSCGKLKLRSFFPSSHVWKISITLLSVTLLFRILARRCSF